MSYNEFFVDKDKPYSENLNDALCLVDAFDLTVPLNMPAGFSNGEFSSNIGITKKCGVGLVTLMSRDSGVTIGTDSISGTGEVVFRVYPNFNSFYKWDKILLEKSGTVDISFRKVDGTEITATVGSDGIISDNNALKQLQEIDVVFTLTSATINNILIWFINNQSTRNRTGALLEASQLVNVNGEVSEGSVEAVNGGTVYNAIDSLSDTVDGKLDLKEDLSNKVSTLNTSTTNYPTCKAVKDKLDLKSDTGHTHTISNVTSLQSILNDKLDFDDLLNAVYPVGAIYIDALSVHSTCPIQILLGGTWERIQGRFLLASEDNQGVGTIGGSADAVVVQHNHTFTEGGNALAIGTTTAATTDGFAVGNLFNHTNKKVSAIAMSGEDGTGKNMPPYLMVNIWRRTE